MAKAKKRRRHKRKKAFGFMSNPKRHRSYRKTRAKRRRTIHRSFYSANPRHRRRRHYRSNPPAIRSIAGELGWTAAGFMTTKVVGNFVTPMVGGLLGTSDIARIGVKIGVAYVSAWGLSAFLGQRVFMPAMIGGSMDAIQDAVKTFIAPTFPMLGEYYGGSMGVYYEPQRRALPSQAIARSRALSLYPELGDGLSPDHDAVV